MHRYSLFVIQLCIYHNIFICFPTVGKCSRPVATVWKLQKRALSIPYLKKWGKSMVIYKWDIIQDLEIYEKIKIYLSGNLLIYFICNELLIIITKQEKGNCHLN